MALSIVPENISVTMSSQSWIILLGILATIHDETGITELLSTRIMDQVEG